MNDEEVRIRNLKQRKLQKQFTAKVNDLKVKISGFHVKPYQDQFEKGQLLILSSKSPFPGLPSMATIQIDHAGECVHVKGRWKCGLHSPSRYTAEYLITEKIKM